MAIIVSLNGILKWNHIIVDILRHVAQTLQSCSLCCFLMKAGFWESAHCFNHTHYAKCLNENRFCCLHFGLKLWPDLCNPIRRVYLWSLKAFYILAKNNGWIEVFKCTFSPSNLITTTSVYLEQCFLKIIWIKVQENIVFSLKTSFY